MKLKKVQKRNFTLMEILIAIALIALIAGAIGYNYIGVLDEGRAFKTKAGMEKLETALSLALADHPEEWNNIESDWKRIVEKSPLVKNKNDIIYDGWGYPYKVTIEQGAITIRSDKYDEFKKSHPGKFRETND